MGNQLIPGHLNINILWQKLTAPINAQPPGIHPANFQYARARNYKVNIDSFYSKLKKLKILSWSTPVDT